MIDPGEVLEVLEDLIVAQESSLLSGITKNGVQRTFKHVDSTYHGEPRDYYYIGINEINSRDTWAQSGGSINAVPSVRTEYDIEIEVVDYALMQHGEEYPYKVMNRHFSLLYSRIATLIETSDTAPFVGASGNKFRLMDDWRRRTIRATQQSGYEQSSNGYQALLRCVLAFTLISC